MLSSATTWSRRCGCSATSGHPTSTLARRGAAAPACGGAAGARSQRRSQRRSSSSGRGLAIAAADDGPARPAMLIELAYARVKTGDVAGAETDLDDAIAGARELGDRAAELRATVERQFVRSVAASGPTAAEERPEVAVRGDPGARGSRRPARAGARAWWLRSEGDVLRPAPLARKQRGGASSAGGATRAPRRSGSTSQGRSRACSLQAALLRADAGRRGPASRRAAARRGAQEDRAAAGEHRHEPRLAGRDGAASSSRHAARTRRRPRPTTTSGCRCAAPSMPSTAPRSNFSPATPALAALEAARRLRRAQHRFGRERGRRDARGRARGRALHARPLAGGGGRRGGRRGDGTGRRHDAGAPSSRAQRARACSSNKASSQLPSGSPPARSPRASRGRDAPSSTWRCCGPRPRSRRRAAGRRVRVPTASARGRWRPRRATS